MAGEVNKLQKFVIGDSEVSLPLVFEPYETKFIVISK
jgi:hypothetical protein